MAKLKLEEQKAKYLPNPSSNWGPKARATGGKKWIFYSFSVFSFFKNYISASIFLILSSSLLKYGASLLLFPEVSVKVLLELD